MTGVAERSRHEYNHRIHQAHYTAQFTRARELPPVENFYIDVDKPVEAKAKKQKMHDPDNGLMQWAMLIATDEQRRKLCR